MLWLGVFGGWAGADVERVWMRMCGCFEALDGEFWDEGFGVICSIRRRWSKVGVWAGEGCT